MNLIPSYGGRFQGEPQWEAQQYWREDIHDTVLVSAYYARQIDDLDLRSYLNLREGDTLWIDSGGYTEMTKGIGALENVPDKDDTEAWEELRDRIRSEQLEILKFQESQEADVGFTFDLPVKPDTPDYARERFLELTKENAITALEEQDRSEMNLYPVVQSWDFGSAREMTEFYDEHDFDGIGVGGLVPYSQNLKKRVEILLGVRSATDKPIHALGATGVPHLYAMAALGVDTVDSQTWADYARFRHYILPQTGQRKCIGKNVESEKQHFFKRLPCSCPFCRKSTKEMRENGYEYASDYLGEGGSENGAQLAMHNLSVMLNELGLINGAIEGEWFNKLLDKKRDENRSINRVVGYIEDKLEEYPELVDRVQIDVDVDVPDETKDLTNYT